MFAISNKSRLFHASKNNKNDVESEWEESEEVSSDIPREDASSDSNSSNRISSNKENIQVSEELHGLAPPELWSVVLQGLGTNYEDIAQLPVWLDASKVESIDWK